MHFLQHVFKSTFMGSKWKAHLSIHVPPLTIVPLFLPQSLYRKQLKFRLPDCVHYIRSSHERLCRACFSALTVRQIPWGEWDWWKSVYVCVCWMAVTGCQWGGFLKLASSTSVYPRWDPHSFSSLPVWWDKSLHCDNTIIYLSPTLAASKQPKSFRKQTAMHRVSRFVFFFLTSDCLFLLFAETAFVVSELSRFPPSSLQVFSDNITRLIS